MFSDTISVIVISFNSEEYIIETLQSIYEQTYEKVELVISDDCSTDQTIKLVNDWADTHSHRFQNFKLITAPVNSGISANLNRGVRAASGKWIKPIAADDILLQNCLQDNIDFAVRNASHVVFSIRHSFIVENNKIKILGSSKPGVFNEPFITAQQQYRLTLWRIGCPANTLFYSREILDALNGFDEEFRLIEDWPMNMRMTGAGFKVHYMHKETFLYRIHATSVFRNGINKHIINKWGVYELFPVFKKYVFPEISYFDRKVLNLRNLIERTLLNSFLNKRNFVNLIIVRSLLYPFDLFMAYKKRKIINKVKNEIGRSNLVYS